jgi:hypothetical protein
MMMDGGSFFPSTSSWLNGVSSGGIPSLTVELEGEEN